MSSCPVCDAPALSGVCEVCGHAFAAETSAAAAPVSLLEGLDVPQRVAGATPVVPLLDLEPTRFETAALPPAGPLDLDWDRTPLADGEDVRAGGLEELESGREATSGERTPPTVASVTCRYCRNVQVAGLMCERCGMRLPWSAKAVSAPAPLDPDVLVRCARCGVRTYQRARCAGCGSELAGQA